MSYYGNRRGDYPQWPHFDDRGPDHYYDNDRRFAPPENNSRRFRNDGPYPPANDSDIYEDDFHHEENAYRRYNGREEPWPEDRFYNHRQQMRPEENFFERGWHRIRDEWREMQGRGTGRGDYPEDRHRHYGRDFDAENRNRGPWIHERFRW